MAQLHASDQALSDIATPKVHPRASRLGERLVERGRLNPQAIEAVLERQKRWGCRFGEALLADGTIRPFELAEALADGWGLPVADLTAEPPDRALCDASHIDLYLGRLFLPWRLVGGVTVVACADPTEATRRIIAQLYGPQTRIAITGKFDIIWTAERMFRERLAHDAAFQIGRAHV